eukprot:CAMPEP_0174237804 /NCGR_PEP_ID=MMETSP0417-20130205/9359_1 /TAXON_ID=242541 /ORGANISM="Mayorella sp, Strain BSH-02190019" /LENGTH=143 /DNA_ID=CAMNT_0015316589 /DNA_START=47 /DNA_END=478 /DNA_ORIENTATION=-
MAFSVKSKPSKSLPDVHFDEYVTECQSKGFKEIGIYSRDGLPYFTSSNMEISPESVLQMVKAMEWFTNPEGDQPVSAVSACGKPHLFITGEPESVYYRSRASQLVAAMSPRSIVVGFAEPSLTGSQARYLLFTMTVRLRDGGF